MTACSYVLLYKHQAGAVEHGFIFVFLEVPIKFAVGPVLSGLSLPICFKLMNCVKAPQSNLLELCFKLLKFFCLFV